METSTAVLLALGFVLVFLATISLLMQLQSFLTHRHLSSLERHGVEGEAIAIRRDVMAGQARVYFEVRLPEGEPRSEFYELFLTSPGPDGTVMPVVYDRRKPSRAKIGTRQEINFRAERRLVQVMGGGGLVMFVVGVVLLFVAR
ncbi:DUF3592 domain-containing protein [Streptomyces swartbergensis]|uniref:DUF3592 domain-containing protein n=1 Tax=Streptomyces swartbergensis TaxID=487165 RepID=A0A243RPQ2_9ACTN|nr:DUF3592 domain-containing protein [Streptomyces swartbergensis]OUC96943.1 hypothetical protein CA983_31140 [Streptomyces swartbergensis]